MSSPSAQEEQNVDVIIVGGGPCGLTLAKGLLNQGYSVKIIEKDPVDLKSHDWSKAYSFRIDVRGLNLLKSLGIYQELTELGVKSEGFKGTKWMPDGSFDVLPPRTLGSVAYWIIRPKFLKLLSCAIPSETISHDEVADIRFDDGSVSVSTLNGKSYRSKFLFGCDGIHSHVRSTLERSVDPDYKIHKIDCPSSGFAYRATLYDPPDSLDPDEIYMIIGETGDKLTLMPVGGERGVARPIAVAKQSTFRIFQIKNPDDLYDTLDKEFPQLQVRERLSVKSAQAWCCSEGSTFPRPRWAGKACGVHKGVFVCLVGDALHCVPPDLGQGVNSGFVDVQVILDFMKNRQELALSSSNVDALNNELVSEARALCQILPIGMPYQYNQPFSIHKVLFFADFMARFALHRLVSNTWFHAPAILEIQDDPPKKYTTILKHHYQTRRRMLALVGSITVVAIGIWKRCGGQSR